VIQYTDWLTQSNETKRWTLIAIAIEAVKEHNEHRREVRDAPHLFPMCVPPGSFYFTDQEYEDMYMEISGLLHTLLILVDTLNFAAGDGRPFRFNYINYNLSLDPWELAQWFASVPSVRNIQHWEIQDIIHMSQCLRRRSAQRRWRRYARRFVVSVIIEYIVHKAQRARARAEARMHDVAIHEAWIAPIEQNNDAPQE
jgi:hypothetical protein